MKRPLISIVMSVYNSEEYITEAIESMLNQTYRNFEFIIIDDGSTDNSLEIIKNYQISDERIVVISRENRGLPYSLNEGIKSAKGEYIVRMDADDISLPHRLEVQIEFMESSHEVGVCGSAVIVFGERAKDHLWKLTQNDNRLKTELLFSSIFAHPSVMIRRKVMIEHNLYYNESFLQAQDFELWSRMAPYTKFFNLQIPLLKYRVSKNSTTTKADKDIEKRYQVIKSIFESNLRQLHINNSEEENRIHFNLTVNTRIRDNEIKFKELEEYFSKILKANNRTKIFNNFELKKVLGKKWLWNFYYRKEVKALFSQYIIYGLWSIIKR